MTHPKWGGRRIVTIYFHAVKLRISVPTKALAENCSSFIFVQVLVTWRFGQVSKWCATAMAKWS